MGRVIYSIFNTYEDALMTDTADQEQITSGLSRIRHKHRWLGVIFILYIPLVCLLYFLKLPAWLVMSTAIFLICLGIVIAFIIGLAPCPACGKPFHVRGMGGSIFTGTCMHCGVALRQG
jgi:uncharacterized ion transporter superfamily protein YfcC